MRLDSHKSGLIHFDQMKKFFVDSGIQHTSFWSDMISVFDLSIDQSSISYSVSCSAKC